jgi:DNA mismatch endonuclease (patch repair protein)
MLGNRRIDTRPEVLVRSALHRRGLRFRKHTALTISGVRVRPDVVFPREKLAVFVDGCFWHRCPQHGTSPRTNSAYWASKLDRNVERDHKIDKLLKAGGWEIARVWEHELPEEAAERVALVVSQRRASRQAAA